MPTGPTPAWFVLLQATIAFEIAVAIGDLVTRERVRPAWAIAAITVTVKIVFDGTSALFRLVCP